jgi:serine/threonine-protein kinase
VILAAMKKYGMLLSDGGNIALTFADDRTSTAKWADVKVTAQSFAAIKADDFEVVELGPEVAVTNDCVRTP